METQGIPVNDAELAIMDLAITEAHQAQAVGEIPVGAVVLGPTGEVIAMGHNQRESSHDPTGHAEIIAIRAAAEALQDRMLLGCTLAVTLEPCVMCAGVIAAARIPRVLFGAWDEKAGAAGSVYDVLRDQRLPHPRVEVVGGVRELESRALLQQFFATRR